MLSDWLLRFNTLEGSLLLACYPDLSYFNSTNIYRASPMQKADGHKINKKRVMWTTEEVSTPHTWDGPILLEMWWPWRKWGQNGEPRKRGKTGRKSKRERTEGFAFPGFSCARRWWKTSNGDFLSSLPSLPCPQGNLNESVFEQIQQNFLLAQERPGNQSIFSCIILRKVLNPKLH